MEYVSNPIIRLKDYLSMSAKQQKEELVNYHPYLVKQWAKTYFDPQTTKFVLQNKNEDYEIVEELKAKFPAEFIDFLDWSYGQLSKNKIEPPPSWYVLQFQSIVKNQWLIHFSDTANQLWLDQTFKFGLENLENIAYSTSYTQEAKKYGGYNFAYDIKDFAKYGRSSYSSKGWKYGKEAVLFKASGIKAYHHGDEEPQVIFWGQTAKDIVHLQGGNDGWMVVNSRTNKMIYQNQLPDVVKWVVSNFNQYRKALLP